MLPTYPAILRDGHLEWGEEGAPAVSLHDSIPVHVTVLTPDQMRPASGPAMAAALEAIAVAGGPSSHDHPVEWQRESRIDRSLPGRAE